MINQTFLIEFDACLDTRLGTLSRISSEGVMAVMNNGYWKRDTDDFEKMSGGLITNQQYKELYAIRDEETLKASMMTQLFDVIGPMTKELQFRQSRQVEIGHINVVINFYPYKLDNETREEILLSLVPFLAVNSRITDTWVSPDKLTPSVLNGMADIAIFYNYDDWFTLHIEELVKDPYPMMTAMVPMLLHNKAQLTEDLLTDPETGQQRDPFKLHSLFLAEFLGVEFQPANVFSSIR